MNPHRLRVWASSAVITLLNPYLLCYRTRPKTKWVTSHVNNEQVQRHRQWRTSNTSTDTSMPKWSGTRSNDRTVSTMTSARMASITRTATNMRCTLRSARPGGRISKVTRRVSFPVRVTSRVLSSGVQGVSRLRRLPDCRPFVCRRRGGAGRLRSYWLLITIPVSLETCELSPGCLP